MELGICGIDHILQSTHNQPVKVYLYYAFLCSRLLELCKHRTPILADDLGCYLHTGTLIELLVWRGENHPSVIAKDNVVLLKLLAAGDRPKDGHAPLLSGHLLDAYILAGIRK